MNIFKFIFNLILLPFRVLFFIVNVITSFVIVSFIIDFIKKAAVKNK